MKIIQIAPADLSLHPALKAQPGEWASEDPRFELLWRDIRDRGVLHPLIVTPDKQILDGRHRWRAAKRLGLQIVPCREAPADEALAIIVGTLLARRHYTAGQRAYLIADLIEDAWNVARQREQAHLRKGNAPAANAVRSGDYQALTSKMSQNPPHLCGGRAQAVDLWAEQWVKTVADYAQELSVSVRLLQQARAIWELYRAYPQKFTWSIEVLAKRGLATGTQLTLREYFEPLILDDKDPMALGRVKEGIAQKIWQAEREAQGLLHPGRAAVLQSVERQLGLFRRAWETLRVRAREYWPKLPPEAKLEVCQALTKEAESMPDDFISQIAAIFQKELNRRRKQRERERKAAQRP